MTSKRRIFISSVQKELAAERRALKDFLQADPLLRPFFDVFLFEDLPASGRHAKMQALVRKAGNQVVRRRFSSMPELTSVVYASLVEYLVRTGTIRTRPFDAAACPDVNAVAHRDYASNASVQVMLFADRLEIWNPGQLPPSLTLEALRAPHASIPREAHQPPPEIRYRGSGEGLVGRVPNAGRWRGLGGGENIY